MYIHNYQIHNVLNVYQRQLAQGLANGKKRPSPKSQGSPQINYKRNRQNIIDKVASNIVNKINLRESDVTFNDEVEKVVQRDFQKDKSMNHKRPNKFSFNIIDQNNQKFTSSITVDNSADLICRFDKLNKNQNNHDPDININI
jgi:hypothetical protein